nr:hypothetical protein CFP56_31693 [Quercus suber]
MTARGDLGLDQQQDQERRAHSADLTIFVSRACRSHTLYTLRRESRASTISALRRGRAGGMLCKAITLELSTVLSKEPQHLVES